MSAPGRYRRPRATFTALPWFGEDRRSADSLNQLARSLYSICREAADPLELAAHLEAIGFNNHRVQREFGLEDTFELARELFLMTPRKPVVRRSQAKHSSLTWLRQLTLLAGISVTLGLQLQANELGWAAVVFLIAWSVVGSRFIDLAASSLKKPQIRAVLGVLSLVGVLGLLMLWLYDPPTLPEALIGALWWALTSMLWLEQIVDRRSLESLIPVAFAALGLLPYPLPLALFLLFAVTLYLLLPHLAPPDKEVWRYLRSHPWFITVLALYGVSLGILFVRLFQSFPAGIVVGGAVMIGISFTAEWGLLWVRRSLTHSLWYSRDGDDYVRPSFLVRALRAQLLLFLTLAAVFFALPFFELSYADTVSRFGLFALSLALALVLLSLNNLIIPAVLFSLAATALGFGVPLAWVMIVLCLGLVVGVAVHVRDVEGYGIYLL